MKDGPSSGSTTAGAALLAVSALAVASRARVRRRTARATTTAGLALHPAVRRLRPPAHDRNDVLTSSR